jgi:hypothetical protein
MQCCSQAVAPVVSNLIPIAMLVFGALMMGVGKKVKKK